MKWKEQSLTRDYAIMKWNWVVTGGERLHYLAIGNPYG